MATPMFDGLAARLTGPMNFRFILQPALAIVMGIRDGRKDAKSGERPFLIDLFTDAAHRKENLVGALKTLTVPIAIGTVLDGISQYLIFRDVPDRGMIIRPLAALEVGATVIGLPYALSRSITNRMMQPKNAPAPRK